jgi:hypothetical protein
MRHPTTSTYSCVCTLLNLQRWWWWWWWWWWCFRGFLIDYTAAEILVALAAAVCGAMFIPHCSLMCGISRWILHPAEELLEGKRNRIALHVLHTSVIFFTPSHR